MRILLVLVSLLMLSSCGGSVTPESTPPTSTQTDSKKPIKTPSQLLMRADTPTRGDSGDFFIRSEIKTGEVNVGDTIDIVEKGGRSISLQVKSIFDSVGEIPRAEKGQMVSIYFDGDATLFAAVSPDSYLVEKGGKYPETTVSTSPAKDQNALIKGKINGADWEGKSILNAPPYYKFGSKAMMSPNIPILKMSFGRAIDNSSVNFDLKGGLKVGSYMKDTLSINYSDNSGTIEYVPTDNLSNVIVEITSYAESGNSAIISGKITGTIGSNDRGAIELNLEWKDIKIDVWGEEAK